MAFSHDSRLLATGSHDNSIRLWKVEDGQLVAVIRALVAGVRDLAFSPDNQYLASVGDESMYLWNAETGELINSAYPWTEFINGGHYTDRVSFSSDGSTIYYRDRPSYNINYGDYHPRLVDVVTFEQTYPYHSTRLPSRDVIFGPQNQLVALIPPVGFPQIFDPVDETVSNPFPEDCVELPVPTVISSLEFTLTTYEYYTAATFSPDGKLLATAPVSGCLLPGETTYDPVFINRVWLTTIGDNPVLNVLEGAESPVVYLEFSPDGKRLLGQEKNGNFHVWDIETGLRSQYFIKF